MNTQENLRASESEETSIGSILKRLMMARSIKLYELSDKTGVAIGNLSRILNDKEANPTLNTLTPLAEFFGVSLGQLVGNEALSDTGACNLLLENKTKWLKIPLILWGNVRDFLQNKKNLDFYKDLILSDIELDEASYALMVEEDDWNYFTKGTVLVIDPVVEPKVRDFIVVSKDHKSKPSLKQLLADDEGEMYLKSMNNEIGKIIPLDKSAVIYGVMRQARKDYK